MICTACNGQSPTRAEVDVVFEQTGDLWGVCDRCRNSHRDPEAPASYTNNDLEEDLAEARLSRWLGAGTVSDGTV